MSAIIVENLGKRYEIGHQVQHDTLRDALVHGMRRFLPGASRRPRADREEFWALNDVSFKIEPGEVVGVIGRNGAGKSTLLKILSRITEPTRGRVTINGRVASLLEVGTGFHPELSGRENIFLNGAILGMGRAEITRKFDEIVAFAEVERFLDTPVKRYSSGMYVRLAFAVAAHLEPEILIVDEVLSVGDAEFQKKCLGKIREVSNSGGRTVLFVSHNIAALQRLCSRGIVLNAGRSILQGTIEEAVNAYGKQSGGGGASIGEFRQEIKKGQVTVTAVTLTNQENEKGAFTAGSALSVEISLTSPTPFSGTTMGFTIADRNGTALFTSHHDDVDGCRLDIVPGQQSLRALIDPNYLLPGYYTLSVGLVDRTWTILTLESECLDFEIKPSPSQTASSAVSRPGNILIPLKWNRL